MWQSRMGGCTVIGRAVAGDASCVKGMMSTTGAVSDICILGSESYKIMAIGAGCCQLPLVLGFFAGITVSNCTFYKKVLFS